MTELERFHSAIDHELNKAGIQSKFTIIKESTVKTKQVVLNTSIFRMPDPYKDESSYIDGLMLLMDNISKYIKGGVLRIYYDDSVIKKDDKWLPIIEKAKNTQFVQLIHYDFPQFKKNDGSFYHEGVFGTIIRFFALFNFTNISEIVSIIDVDFLTTDDIIEVANIITGAIKTFKDTKTTFMFNTYSITAYIRKPRLLINDMIKKYDFTTRMIVQPTTCAKKLNTAILIDFMTCMVNQCPLYKNWLNDLISALNCESIPENNLKRAQQCLHLKEIKKQSHGIFAFGVDELFLNTMILEEFLKNKKQFLLYYQIPNFTNFHYCLYNRFQKRKINIKFMYDMYEAVLGKKLVNAKEIHKTFEEIDKIIYVQGEKAGYALQTEKAKKIYKLLYDFLKPRVNMLFKLPNLEVYERMMFECLRDTDEKDFIIGKYFYKVTYSNNKKYKLIRQD